MLTTPVAFLQPPQRLIGATKQITSGCYRLKLCRNDQLRRSATPTSVR